MTKSPRAVAREALRLAKDALPAYTSARSRKVEALIEGSPVLLARDGQVYKDVLRRELVSREDFEKAMREAGIDDISDIRLAVLETNGHVTMVPRA